MRAVAKWLTFRQPACTSPIALALFYFYANRLPSADLCHLVHDIQLWLSLTRLAPRAQVGFGAKTKKLSHHLLTQIEGILPDGQNSSESKMELFVPHCTTVVGFGRQLLQSAEQSVPSFAGFRPSRCRLRRRDGYVIDYEVQQ